MATEAYTLIMTQGVHSILRESYESILKAIENGDKTVEVQLDLLRKRDYAVRTTIVTAHVVAMAEMPLVDDVEPNRGKERHLSALS